MKTKKAYLFIASVLLLALWVPVSIDKLSNLSAFRASMLRQPFPDSWAAPIVWILPPLELLAALLIVGRKSRVYGMGISFGLLWLFTIYVGLGMAGLYGRIPCGCGALVSWLSFDQHFWFNLLYTVVAGAGLWLCRRSKNQGGGRRHRYRKPIQLWLRQRVVNAHHTFRFFFSGRRRLPRRGALFRQRPRKEPSRRWCLPGEMPWTSDRTPLKRPEK